MKLLQILMILILSLLSTNTLYAYSNGSDVSTKEEQVIELYIATFNRAPDRAGLDYWLNEMTNNHWTAEMVAQSMFMQPETENMYGDKDLKTFIKSVYENVLNREPDSAGLDYWYKDLSSGNIPKERFVIAIINGAKANGDDSDDAKVLKNKVAVGKYFTLEKGLNDVELARKVISEVSSDDTSVTKIKQEIDKDTSGDAADNTDVTCNLPVITDDSGFEDVYPSEGIKWSAKGTTVQDIADAFNNARAKDSTINKKLVMPSQEVWDSMSDSEKGLYLINKERYDRGLKPFDGIDPDVQSVAQQYAQTLHDTGKFAHDVDGSPWDRLDRDPKIKNNTDFFQYGENLAAFAATPNYPDLPMAKSVYNWIYDDAGSNWGHRKFVLAKLNDNSGEEGSEGLIGFGIIKSDDWAYYDGWNSYIIVMDGIDPAPSWDYSNTQRVSLCPNGSNDTGVSNSDNNTNQNNDRFTILDDGKLIVDNTTGLMWQNADLNHDDRDAAVAECDNLVFEGYDDWRLASTAEDKEFHYQTNLAGITPRQLFADCTAEVTTDGYVRTKKGAQQYGGNPGDEINFSGPANVRCVRNNK